MASMLCDYFDIQDFFTAGLGLDIAGAVLLARGVISSALDLTRISGSFWGSQPYVATAMARDRIDAMTGLAALALGFVLQAVGYTLLLALDTSADSGWRKATTAVGLLLLSATLVVTAGWTHRRLRLIPTLIEMSRFTLDGGRQDYPRAQLLPSWLRALGHERLAGEDDLAFVRRTAGVENMVVEVAPLRGTEEGRKRLWTDPPLEEERVE